ncbi:hypothetical protein ACI797_25625 [Geodermatophilus sp. SYSU D00691]
MDLNQAAQRILRRHWLVILVMVLAGVAVPLQLARMQEPTYQASARLTIGTWDTRDVQESSALADTALAIATSRDTVTAALQAADLWRPRVTLVENVQVASVGTSGVLELTVVDGSPRAAAALADAFAQEIVRIRDEAIFGASRQSLADLDARIAEVDAWIESVENAAARAVAQLRDVEALALQHDQAVAERAQLGAQRERLVATLATAVAPRIVASAGSSGSLVPTAVVTRLAIGGLLGLVLGVAIAATLESWRPTLDGPATARHLGAPLLARLRRAPLPHRGLGDRWLANYLTLAADAAGVRTVQLVAAGPQLDLSGLARELDDDEGGPRVVPLSLGGAVGEEGSPRIGLPGSGLVVIAPDTVKGTSVFDPVERHAELARQPVVGVITYKGRVRRADRRAAAPTSGAAETEPSALPAP